MLRLNTTDKGNAVTERSGDNSTDYSSQMTIRYLNKEKMASVG